MNLDSLIKACNVFLKTAKENWIAGAVIIENEREEVLLLLRGPGAPWMPGKWNLPGGTSDEGEDPKQTAIREAEEETHLQIHGLHLIHQEQIDEGKIYIFHTNNYSGDFNLTWENSDFVWVSKNDALSYDLVPGVRNALQKLTSDNS